MKPGSISRYRCPVWRVASAVAVALVVALSGACAFAQQVDAFSFREPVLKDVEIDRLVEILHLSEAQIDAVHGIVGPVRQWQRDMDAQYRRRLKEQAEFDAKAQARIRAVKESGSLEGRGYLPEELANIDEFNEWYDNLIATAREKSRGVLEDIGAILYEKQQPVWEGFIRDWRRSRTLEPGAAFAAERVDLKILVDELTIDRERRAALEPILAEYSRTVDPLLVRRNELIRAEHEFNREQPFPGFRKLNQQLHDQEISSDEFFRKVEELSARHAAMVLDTMQSRYAAHEAIRDTTLSSFDVVLRMLPGEEVGPAQEAFALAAYPDIVSPLQADAILDQALTLEDLSSGQRDALMDLINVQWKLARHQIDVQLMRVRDESESAWRERREAQEDPGIDARRDELLRKRQAIQKTIITQVREMLSTGQRALIAWPETINLYPRL